MKEIENAIEWLKNDNNKHITRDQAIHYRDLVVIALEKQLNNGWVPVIERLPDKEDQYQVTVKYENFAGIYITVTTATFYNDRDWNITGVQHVITNKKVTAWKPLSEPYEEKANEI